MSRSLPYLRRALLGLAVVGSLGFGATAALARPDVDAVLRQTPVCPEGSEPCFCDGYVRCRKLGACYC